MIERSKYIKQLITLNKKNIVKVIYGIPGVGKTTLLNQFKTFLNKKIPSNEQILYFNFLDLKNEKLKDYKKLYEHISLLSKEKEYTYILIDEIQKVNNYIKIIQSLLIKENVDLYLTFDNIKNLQNDDTIASHMYFINILPLTFDELNTDSNDIKTGLEFDHYFRFGGLPFLTNISEFDIGKQYVESIYNAILVNNIIAKKKVSDVVLLNNLFQYLCDNLSNFLSSKKISDNLTLLGNKTNHLTIKSYLEYLQDANLIFKINRLDIKNNQILKSLHKYYFIDISFKQLLFFNKKANIKGLLENIIFVHLLKNDYDVFVGKLYDNEISFVASKNNKRIYISVYPSLMDDKKLNAAVELMNRINDNYPKYLVTMDGMDFIQDGIHHKNIKDFLMLKL